MPFNILGIWREEKGDFVGTIYSIELKLPQCHLYRAAPDDPVPETEDGGKRRPDYQLSSGGAYIGCGWRNANKDTGLVTVSVVINDPSLKKPIKATLRQIKGDWALCWEWGNGA